MKDLACTSGRVLLFREETLIQKGLAIDFYNNHQEEINKDYKEGQYLGINQNGVLYAGKNKNRVIKKMLNNERVLAYCLVVKNGTKNPPLMNTYKIRATGTTKTPSNNENEEIVKLKILSKGKKHRKTINAVLDTGATNTCLKSEIFSAFTSNKNEGVICNAILYDGSQMKTVEYTGMHFEIPGTKKQFEIDLLEGPQNLLGYDAFKLLKHSIDPRNKTHKWTTYSKY